MKHWEKILKVRAIFHVRDLSVYTASVCFYMALSLIPTASLLVIWLSYLSNGKLLLDHLCMLLPPQFSGIVASVFSVLSNKTPFRLISFSGLLTVWSAAKSIQAVRRGLNLVMEIREDRSYFHSRFRAALTLLPLLMILPAAIVITSIGSELLSLLQMALPGLNHLLKPLQLYSNLSVFIMMVFVFSVVYRFVPSVKNQIGKCFLVGAVVSLIWHLLSAVFSIYIRYISSYETVYGTLGLITLGLLWMQCSVGLVLYGGRWLFLLQNERYNPIRFIRGLFYD